MSISEKITQSDNKTIQIQILMALKATRECKLMLTNKKRIFQPVFNAARRTVEVVFTPFFYLPTYYNKFLACLTFFSQTN